MPYIVNSFLGGQEKTMKGSCWRNWVMGRQAVEAELTGNRLWKMVEKLGLWLSRLWRPSGPLDVSIKSSLVTA